MEVRARNVFISTTFNTAHRCEHIVNSWISSRIDNTAGPGIAEHTSHSHNIKYFSVEVQNHPNHSLYCVHKPSYPSTCRCRCHSVWGCAMCCYLKLSFIKCTAGCTCVGSEQPPKISHIWLLCASRGRAPAPPNEYLLCCGELKNMCSVIISIEYMNMRDSEKCLLQTKDERRKTMDAGRETLDPLLERTDGRRWRCWWKNGRMHGEQLLCVYKCNLFILK